MSDLSDTIAAIATAQAPAGIGIIRLSGAASVRTVNRIFENTRGERVFDSLPAGFLKYGFVTDSYGRPIDEIMAVRFETPHSYTGEDMAELQCHGGLFVLRQVLLRVLEVGAPDGVRLAEPGEFTKRAFLNGRIDLTQAEAVMDIISADSKASLNNAERQAGGALSLKVRELRSKLLNESAFIESALDDPDSFGEALSGYPERLSAVVQDINDQLDKLVRSSETGIILREGVKTAIVGRPNAGKSSLLNLLLGYSRAIVSSEAGTTRDTLEEKVHIGGITLKLIDTAGLDSDGTRDVGDIEKTGMERARKAMDEADLVLFVIDAAKSVTDEDVSLLKSLKDTTLKLIVFNKSDLIKSSGSGFGFPEIFAGTPSVLVSAKTGDGLESLRDNMEKLLVSDDGWTAEDVIVTNLRHRELLNDAIRSMNNLLKTIDDGLSEDFYTIDLMNGYRALGEIIGEEVGDDLVDEIFSKFCMGK